MRRSTLRMVQGVTAFAVGHSCALVLGALGRVALPTRLVESGIALSVLVSAIHAVPTGTSLLTTLLGFDLGIELTQQQHGSGRPVVLVAGALSTGVGPRPAEMVPVSGLVVVPGSHDHALEPRASVTDVLARSS